MDAKHIAEALGGRKSGNGYMCCCPAHDDKNPSLWVADGDRAKVVVKCFSGCEFVEVARALEAKGLWPKDDNKEEWKKKKAQERYEQAKLRIAIAMAAIRSGGKLSEEDRTLLEKSKKLVKWWNKTYAT